MKKAEKILAEIILSQVQCPSAVMLTAVKRDNESDSIRRIDFEYHTKKHNHGTVGSAVDCLAFFLVKQVDRRYHTLTRQRVYELICLRFRYPIKSKHWDDDYRAEHYKDEPAYEDPEDTGYLVLLFETLKMIVDRQKLYRCNTPEEVLRKADLFSKDARDERRVGKQFDDEQIKAAKKDGKTFHREVVPAKKRKTALKQLRIRKLHKPRSRR